MQNFINEEILKHSMLSSGYFLICCFLLFSAFWPISEGEGKLTERKTCKILFLKGFIRIYAHHFWCNMWYNFQNHVFKKKYENYNVIIQIKVKVFLKC